MALKGIDDTLTALVNCVSDELDESDAPVCLHSNTIGTPAIASCCECTPGKSGELWGNFLRLYQGHRETGVQVQPRKPCAPATWVAQFQITLARCFPTLTDQGELPHHEDQAAAAMELHADVAAIRRAIHCCQDTEPATLEAINVQADPSGGCSYLVATLTVPVSMKTDDNKRQ